MLELALRDGPIDYDLTPGRQRDLFNDRTSQFRAKTASLNTNIERISKEMSSTEQDIRIVNQQLAIEKELEAAKLDLYRDELISNTQLLESKSKRLSVERDFQRLTSKLLELRSTQATAVANKQEYISQWLSLIHI